MTSQINGLTIVYSTAYSGSDQRKHQSSASLAFGQGIHRWPVNSPHKWPAMRKMFPFDDVMMMQMQLRMFLSSVAISLWWRFWEKIFVTILQVHITTTRLKIRKNGINVHNLSLLQQSTLSQTICEPLQLTPFNHSVRKNIQNHVTQHSAGYSWTYM